MPRKNLLSICLLAWLAIPVAATAEEFRTVATIHCPASVTTPAATGIPIADTAMTTFTQVPCAGIRVTVMDADPGWDEYCGAAYTDARGQISIPSKCSDTIGGPPDVYLKIEGRSALGFSVGTHDYGFWDLAWDAIVDTAQAIATGGASIPVSFWDFMRSHETFAWIGDEMAPTGNGAPTADFGPLGIGVPSPGVPALRDISVRSARQLWVAQYSMQRITRGTSQRAMDFDYSVDTPLFGSPTTLYDTVIVEDDEFVTRPVRMLNATPHEIGHVFYNTLHSGFLHWTFDGPDYMTEHNRCDTGHLQTLAWYEGFADFVADWVFNHYDWHAPGWAHAPPGRACATRGIHIEGNVQALLNEIYFGPIHGFTLPGITAPTPNDFTCPPDATRIELPNGAVECQRTRTTPIDCSHPTAFLVVDRTGTTDYCFIEGPGTPPAWAVASCPTGEALHRQSGRDECRRTWSFPATHTIPGGNPAVRADGSPSEALARTPAGDLMWFQLPALWNFFDWVENRGTDAHRWWEFWEDEILPWCEAGPPRYCDPSASQSFRTGLTTIAPPPPN